MALFDGPMNFADPNTLALLGAAQALGQAAMPSRLPVPTGAVFGNLAGGLLQGGVEGNKAALQAAQARLASTQADKLGDMMKVITAIANRATVPGGTPQTPISEMGVSPSSLVAPMVSPQVSAAPATSSDTADDTLPPHARALLDTIAGPESRGAYNARYGGGKADQYFASYDKHPQIRETIPQGQPYAGLTSDAAGRYQFLSSTFNPLGFSDFQPKTQDQAAWKLASDTYKEKTGNDLLADLQAGKTANVAEALKGQWSTLRGAMPAYAANLAKYQKPTQLAQADTGTMSDATATGPTTLTQRVAGALPANWDASNVTSSAAPPSPINMTQQLARARGLVTDAAQLPAQVGQAAATGVPPQQQSVPAAVTQAVPQMSPGFKALTGNITPQAVQQAINDSTVLSLFGMPVPPRTAELAKMGATLLQAQQAEALKAAYSYANAANDPTRRAQVAAAVAAAEYPFKPQRPGAFTPEPLGANGRPTGLGFTAPVPHEMMNADQTTSPGYIQMTPQGPVVTPVPGVVSKNAPWVGGEEIGPDGRMHPVYRLPPGPGTSGSASGSPGGTVAQVAGSVSSPSGAPTTVEGVGATKFSPGEESAMKQRGEKVEDFAAEVDADAAKAMQTRTTLANMDYAVQRGFAEGKTADAQNMAAQYLRLIDPSWNGQVANYEDYVKNLGTVTRQAVRETSARAAVQEFTMIGNALPEPNTSPQGKQQMLAELIGNEQYKLAKQQAQQQWRDTHNQSVVGFESDFARRVSPYAFVVARMSRDSRNQLYAAMNKTQNGLHDRAVLERQLQYLVDHPGMEGL